MQMVACHFLTRLQGSQVWVRPSLMVITGSWICSAEAPTAAVAADIALCSSVLKAAALAGAGPLLSSTSVLIAMVARKAELLRD
jgi:hypothetical protein